MQAFTGKDKARPCKGNYASNATTWMNKDIMTEVLSKLSRQLMRRNRRILLLSRKFERQISEHKSCVFA